MNVDYTLQSTPANARKIAFMQSIMRLNVDPAVTQQAGEGLLTIDDIRSRVPEKLHRWLSNLALDIIQFSTDHNDRCLLGARSFQQAAGLSLLAAFNSGKQILIAKSSGRQKAEEMWGDFLTQTHIKYSLARGDDQEVDHDAQVLLIEQRQLQGKFMNQVRDRVLVYVEGINSRKPFDIGDLFSTYSWENTAVGSFREFPKVISAFHISQSPAFTSVEPPIDWWREPIVHELLGGLHPNLNTRKVLTENQHERNILMQMGFTLLGVAPAHIGRLVGLHVDALTKGILANDNPQTEDQDSE